MKIYTKTGDKGTTSRYDGTRVPKDDQLIVAVAKIDSLLGALDSSFIVVDKEFQEIINNFQEKLWQTAGEVSLGNKGKKVNNIINEKNVEELEKFIDKYHDENHSFVRFRSEAAVRLNESRIRCRKVEVALTPLFREGKIRPEVYQYINRLSDLLFVMACFCQNK